jgi:uncharacterized protein YuzB (UPF0349 family)
MMPDHDTTPDADSDTRSPAIERALRGADGDRSIEYCIRNVDPGDRERVEALEGDVREHFCLQRCGACDAEPFLVVDGEYVAGDHERLADALAAEVEP